MELDGSQQEISQVSYIISLLSHALRDRTFACYTKKWLLSATLAEILNIHYNIPKCIRFKGNDIVTALRNRRLLESHNLSGVLNDCFEDNTSGIYRVVHQDLNGTREYLFYLRGMATISRRNPIRSSRKAEVSITTESTSIKRSTEHTPGPMRTSKRQKNRQKSAPTQMQSLQRPPSGSSSWLKERRTYHRTVTKKVHRLKQSSLSEGSTAKIIQDALQKKTLVDLSSSRMPREFIPQKLFSSPAIVRKKATAVLLDGRQQEDNVNLYWYSTEARQLFCPNLPEEDNLFVHLQKRIELLNEALRVEKTFDSLLDGTLTTEDLSKWEYKKISAKMRCLRKATELALQSMGVVEGANWNLCCSKTVAWANGIGGSEYPKVCDNFNKQQFFLSESQTHSLHVPKRSRQQMIHSVRKVLGDGM